MIRAGLDTADADIVAGRETVADEILENDADMGVDVTRVHVPEVDAIHGDAALTGDRRGG
jgi:hypothetical protein